MQRHREKHGSVAREAAYELVEELRPDRTRLVALSLLVLGDEEARSTVAGRPCLTIDGCRLGCARKMVELSGGVISRAFEVLEVHRAHRELKPQGIAELNEDGLRLARLLAEEAAGAVDAASSREIPEPGGAGRKDGSHA